MTAASSASILDASARLHRDLLDQAETGSFDHGAAYKSAQASM